MAGKWNEMERYIHGKQFASNPFQKDITDLLHTSLEESVEVEMDDTNTTQMTTNCRVRQGNKNPT